MKIILTSVYNSDR